MAKLRLVASQASAVAALPHWETLGRPFRIDHCGAFPVDGFNVGRGRSVYVVPGNGRYMVYLVEGDLVVRQCRVEVPVRPGDNLQILTRRTERLAKQVCRQAALELGRQLEQPVSEAAL